VPTSQEKGSRKWRNTSTTTSNTALDALVAAHKIPRKKLVMSIGASWNLTTAAGGSYAVTGLPVATDYTVQLQGSGGTGGVLGRDRV
jgi:hypothetical protein